MILKLLLLIIIIAIEEEEGKKKKPSADRKNKPLVKLRAYREFCNDIAAQCAARRSATTGLETALQRNTDFA
jgi:hypothetical protein